MDTSQAMIAIPDVFLAPGYMSIILIRVLQSMLNPIPVSQYSRFANVLQQVMVLSKGIAHCLVIASESFINIAQ